MSCFCVFSFIHTNVCTYRHTHTYLHKSGELQQRQPCRSHQILSGEFGKHAWAKAGVICAPCSFRKDSRADHTSIVHCDLRALFFQQRQPRRSHHVLSGELGKHAWAKSEAIRAPCFFREDSRADHTREEFFGAAFVFKCYNWYVKKVCGSLDS